MIDAEQPPDHGTQRKDLDIRARRRVHEIGGGRWTTWRERHARWRTSAEVAVPEQLASQRVAGSQAATSPATREET